MNGWRLARLVGGKVVYGGACLLAAVLLVVAAYAHKVVVQISNTGQGVQISGSPSVGAMNILVMGLESRTNYEGQELDHHLQVVLHSGSNGSQDTNTLILIHIFAGGKKAVGFSIPRDSLVQFPRSYLGYTEGKIDAPYAWAYNQYLDQHPNEPSAARYLHANQAGQLATVDTVQSVTGVKIDHFMEVNLVEFYYLAQAFGGIEVCVMPAPASKEPAGMPAGTNLTDQDPLTGSNNSNFNAYKDGYNKSKGGAQYLHLDAAQSLAFVRSRDTLPGIDLGRTHRQQAAIDYVIWKLKNEGTLGDFGTINSLLATASRDIIVDKGFNVLDFATEMRALTGKNLSLSTLNGTPVNNVTVPGYPNPQDVLEVNVPAIQKTVHDAFYPPSPSSGASASASGSASPSALAAASVTVDVYNGGGASGLADQVSRDLVARGYKAGAIANSTAQSQPVSAQTQVFYGAGAAGNAASIASDFGVSATALSSLPADHVEVLIGSSVTQAPSGLTSSGAASASTQSVDAQVLGALVASASSGTPTASSSTAAGNDTAGTVTVAPNAKYGIPCVY